jgi:5S rRNA maturation endonuclease (ribonuclease M5)
MTFRWVINVEKLVCPTGKDLLTTRRCAEHQKWQALILIFDPDNHNERIYSFVAQARTHPGSPI